MDGPEDVEQARAREAIHAAAEFIEVMRAAGAEMEDVDAACSQLSSGVDQYNLLPRLETLEIAMEAAMAKLADPLQPGVQ